jgi:MFS family permease
MTPQDTAKPDLLDLVPLKDVASYRSYVNVIQTTGRSIGGPLGGYIAQTLGWRWYASSHNENHPYSDVLIIQPGHSSPRYPLWPSQFSWWHGDWKCPNERGTSKSPTGQS